jgi:CheY-like chemotaxis protein
MMGGQIWLESEPGVGSTFIFTAWLEVGSEAGRLVPAQLMKLSALVVDDNPRRARSSRRAPAWWRAVDAVSGGAEAVAAVEAARRDRALRRGLHGLEDAGVDGLEATRRIKGDAGIRKQPAVVMVTAFGREEVREEAERLDIDGFLLKPVTKSMLVDTLVTLFSPPTARPAPRAGRPSTRVRLDGLRVLLVEDNEINQQVAVELIEGVGGVVTSRATGARRAAAGGAPDPFPIDVVLMDVQMPEMDGYQATARLRAQARFAHASDRGHDRARHDRGAQRCVAAGMNDHVSKPIDPDALYGVLAPLRRGRSRRRARAAAAPGDAAGGRGPRRRAGPAARRGQPHALRAAAAAVRRQATRTPRSASARASERRARQAERHAPQPSGEWPRNLAAGPVQAAAGTLRRRSATVRIPPPSKTSRKESWARARTASRAALRAGARRARGAETATERPADPAGGARAGGGRAALVKRWSRLLADCDGLVPRRPREGERACLRRLSTARSWRLSPASERPTISRRALAELAARRLRGKGIRPEDGGQRAVRVPPC